MTPKLIIISGSSGAGKSSALRLLEDEGYYCVDNLPPRLLPEFSREIVGHPEYERFRGVAVCIDARAVKTGVEDNSELMSHLTALPDCGFRRPVASGCPRCRHRRRAFV